MPPIDRVKEGFAIVLALHVPAMLFVDRAQLKSRLAGLFGIAQGLPATFFGPGAGRLWFAFCLLNVMDVWLPTAAPRQQPPWTLGQKVILCVVVVGLIYVVLEVIRIRRRSRQTAVFLLSRGVLLESITKIARKVGFFEAALPRFYVLPHMSLASQCIQLGIVVLVPRQLLDLMSRSEIDTLVARQLFRQSKQYYAPLFWTLLACDAVAAFLAEWLEISATMRWVAFLSLLAAQFAALAMYLPRVLAQADFRAVKLTGDPEAFLSGMAGLSRFCGAPLSEASAREIARQSGIPADRIPALLAERSVPAENRYPTSGSYLTTGLP